MVGANNIAANSINVVNGCVWTTVCASWTVYGVAPTQWIVATSAGANQGVSSTVSLGAVTLLVTDLAGHPLPGASVNIYQSVAGWEPPCPGLGRCPSVPVLSVAKSEAISDAGGFVTVTPLQIASQAQFVRIAASTGSQGFTALTLVKTP